ncbi:MAG: hypothetical protein WB820_22235, partial [Rhodoplanes sp.]
QRDSRRSARKATRTIFCARRPLDAACRHLSRVGRLFRDRPVAEDGPRAHLCSAGQQFGPGGETWLRFNSATLRPILKEALEQG